MTVSAGQRSPSGYPVDFEVDGPFSQGRLTVFFRFFMIIPHVIALYFLGMLSGVVTLIAWFAIVITGSYPAGMLKFSTDMLHWTARVTAYIYLVTGKYPPFAMGEDAGYPARLLVQPQTTGRNRMTTLLRVFMLIPHIFVLYLFLILASVVHFIAFWVALFTGSVPVGMHNFLVGVLRYNMRYSAYALLLVDDFPPFGTT